MNQAEREKLAHKIAEAFIATPYPANGYVGRELQEDFAHKAWQDITPEILFRYREYLHNFSIEGFRFFLPAFLTGIIMYPKKVDMLVDTIITALLPPERYIDYEYTILQKGRKGGVPEAQLLEGIANSYRYREEHFQKQVAAFSPDEKRVIYDFLNAYFELVPDVMENEYQFDRVDSAVEFWKKVCELSDG